MTKELDNEQRDTLKRIFSHPSSGNIEWRQVRALLEAVGTATEEHNGKLKAPSATRPRCCSRRTARTSTSR